MRSSLFLIPLAVSTAAPAQSSNCHWTAGGWTCEEDNALDYGAILQSGRNMVPQYRAQPINRSAQLHRTVGRLISQGKCADAEKLALREGDIELAQAVRGYCGG